MSHSASIKSMKPWHEELIDFMLAQPRAGLKETSEYFGVSIAWLSTVKNSDAFRDAWAQRRGEHSSTISATLTQRVEALAETALETMQQKLEREGMNIGLSTLREVSETALKSLGFGMRDPRVGMQTANSITNNNMIVVDRDTLARARQLRANMRDTLPVPSLETPSQEQTALLAGAIGGESAESEAEAPIVAPLLGEELTVGAAFIEIEHDPPESPPDKDGKTYGYDEYPVRRPGSPEVRAAQDADQSVLDLFGEISRGKK